MIETRLRIDIKYNKSTKINKDIYLKMEFTPTEDQFEKICIPAFEDITSICDEMNFQIKCGNDYIIDFLENIIKSYRNNESIFKKQIEIEPNL